MIIKRKKNVAASLALALYSVGTVGQLSVATIANADEIQKQTAGGFDLTKQATKATFPVMFDRPTGLNAAALASAFQGLQGSSNHQIYDKAIAAVPELADSAKMASLMSDAINGDATAKATIVKLIEFYNSLGGTPITTQAGAAYTVDNLSEPINVLAVAFANDAEYNTKISQAVRDQFANAKSVDDVMAAFEQYAPGVTSEYKAAFEAYAAKVYAEGADIKALSEYKELAPVLNAYEKMYADGAVAIRKQLLNDAPASVTEAAVVFFESAVITGQVEHTDNGGSTTNELKVTKYVDEDGNEISSRITGKEFGNQKDITNYTFKESKEEGNTRTYVYKKNQEPKDVTRWVDESGKELKKEENGKHKDIDGNDVPGYTLVKITENVKDGNTTITNIYKKNEVKKNDTYWLEKDTGKSLKEKAEGQLLPDNDGKSDIPGYKLVGRPVVITEELAKGTSFKVGDIVNIYEKEPEAPKVTEDTVWVDQEGKTLKEKSEGLHPDKEGDDIKGYTLVSVKESTDKDGNKHVVNVYKKNAEPVEDTSWVDESGKALKDKVNGTFPDKEGDDIEGYTLVGVKQESDSEGNKHTINVYRKTPEQVKITTKWVDVNGKQLREETEGSHPDKEGDDIKGYVIVSVKTDDKGNVVNTYRPNTTEWVEDGTGKELQPKQDGQFPDKEGDDIKGYEFVRTETSEEGDVRNIYKVAAKEVITHWGTKDGDKFTKLVDSEKGKEFGKEKSFDGYKLVRTEKSEDGTQLFYIYEKAEKPAAKPLPKTGAADLSMAGMALMGTASTIFGIRKRKNAKK
jgi:hypothetical protein